MGLYNAELFNNIGLCCYYAQHYDMIVNCFERALSLAIEENAGDVWFNIAHVAIVRFNNNKFIYFVDNTILHNQEFK